MQQWSSVTDNFSKAPQAFIGAKIIETPVSSNKVNKSFKTFLSQAVQPIKHSPLFLQDLNNI